jgi:ubiquinol-cytochrome c reductase cytochrome b subunit
MVGVAVFLMIFSAIIFFAPELGGYFLEYNNFIPADSLKTPPHRAGLVLHAVLLDAARHHRRHGQRVLRLIVAIAAIWPCGRAAWASPRSPWWSWPPSPSSCSRTSTPSSGAWSIMGGAVIILFFLPWLDHSPVKSIRYRPGWHKYVYGVFVVFFFVPRLPGHPAAVVWGNRSSLLRADRHRRRYATSASSC